MSTTRATTLTQNTTPSLAPGDSSNPIHGGPYTNRNANPLANTVNGDTSSLAASTHIQNYQCQNPQSHYTHCNFYTGDHSPAAQDAASDRPVANAAALPFHTTPPHPAHDIELRSLFVPFYWPWTLLNSFIRVVLRAAAIAGTERAPHDILPRHTQDLENHPNRDDRFPGPFDSTPSLPGAEENV
ncbi:hypothetical protein PQX77_009543 [Marasmius sp. AFHP31]|nr:hypothetical protein PQX77_009543 [Marasmius sp. AFHP31]